MGTVNGPSLWSSHTQTSLVRFNFNCHSGLFGCLAYAKSEIEDGLDLLWRNNVEPSKVVLGLAFYGRAFTLKDPSCNKPMCAFEGVAEPGYCVGTGGILSNAEIRRVLDKTGAKPILDRDAGVKYMSWDNQW